MGIDAAMMVMADSAVARMTSWVVASVKSLLPMPGRVVILTMDVTPAKMPMDMATRTPNFSFLFIVRDQMIFQGIIARTMSIAPEYAGHG